MINDDIHSNYISGKTGDWEIVIGLEIHAQVLSSSKLFSGACLLYTSPSPRDMRRSRMPSSA